ncbi:MAG: hypothetical protein MJ107_06260 [Lachnospiraceae bacterium]|nr:hypothetical protein [Lachnospiraceae bacterium]
MGLIACNCPNCNGQLDFDENREIMFCSYCGTKVLREQVLNVTVTNGVQLHDANWYYNNIISLYHEFRDSDAQEICKDFVRNYPLDSRIEYCRNYRTENNSLQAVKSKFYYEKSKTVDDGSYSGHTYKKSFSVDGLQLVHKYGNTYKLTSSKEDLEKLRKIATSCKDSEMSRRNLQELEKFLQAISDFNKADAVNEEVFLKYVSEEEKKRQQERAEIERKDRPGNIVMGTVSTVGSIIYYAGILLIVFLVVVGILILLGV